VERKRNPFAINGNTRLSAISIAAGALVAGATVTAVVVSRGGGGPAEAGPVGGSPTALASLAPGHIGGTPTAVVTPPPTPTPNPVLADPSQLLREGQFSAAAATFSAIADRASNSGERAEAMHGAAVAKNEAGDANGGISAAREAVQSAPQGGAIARRAAFVLGRRLNEAGKPDEAAPVLKPFADTPLNDAMQPYIVTEYAKALTKQNKTADARAAWTLVANSGGPADLVVAADRALATLAEAPAGRVPWLTQALGVREDGSVRYDLAQAEKGMGDATSWAADLRTLISRTPASGAAVKAVADLNAAHEAIDPGDEGLVYYRAGRLADAKAVLEPAAADTSASPAALSFRNFFLGAALEDLHDDPAAIAAYDRAAAADASYRHRARYWAARVTEDTGDARGAAARYLALATEGPSGDFSEEAAFRAGYVLLASGDSAGAAAAWERLGIADDARILYWKGRALSAAGSPDAPAAYSAAMDADPMGFYGTEAARALGKAATPNVHYQKRTAPAPTDWGAIEAWLNAIAPGTMPAAPRTAAGDLVSVGLTHEAESAILDAARGGGPWDTLALMKEASDARLPSVAAQLAVRLRGQAGATWQTAPVDLLRLAYPLDYFSLLDSESRANNIDPLFLAALIRQESYWDASAGSSAGALGLTQVIPETGAAIAQSLGLSFTADDLFRPAISIRFGANYIGGQLQRLGSPYLALAAYNAGPGNAARWAEAGGALPPADLVESIDIPETRGYVEYVMDHYEHYLAAYR
jgi:soluble lytic murein transglycosylase